MTLIMSKTAGKHVRRSANQDKNPNPVCPAKYVDLGTTLHVDPADNKHKYACGA